VLQFISRGVLAFDRIGTRIPQLVRVWLIDLFFAMSLTFFIAKVIDNRGAFGVPCTGESLPGACWARIGGVARMRVLLLSHSFAAWTARGRGLASGFGVSLDVSEMEESRLEDLTQVRESLGSLSVSR
jgi:hypothetical protein